ncbi:sigma-54 dependent transcriptional regulator [Entomomonas sp. E2T0]|uniref:sigma-54-dependent transcriptional regulator n=1 Tax=Entomomonas sp. E2T0 TaxID=2930213 RepID=UPI00222848CC|nr:sigma-54 dependent transcriptional regulator [Entomomonas sp. E2T0]UYZ85101.1 sigma-54 dependent transcriptional regulator [Entomomonas sp. E2T0]
MSHILLVEDEVIIRTSLKRLLERHQYQVSEAGSVAEAQENYKIASFDLVITDLRLPGAPGTDMINLAQGVPVLIMTSYASLRSAIDSMKMGAVEYIAKPFDHDDMLRAVAESLAKKQVNSDKPAEGKRETTAKAKNNTKGTDIIGSSPLMQKLFEKIEKVAPTNSTVLILGESGTGKELVARTLHEQSPRFKAPLISVNCAAIPETLIESELFGHEKGAFTGATSSRTGLIEAANGGTLFLDEIGELPLEAQARLLRVLQEGEIRRVGSVASQKVDVRLIAATHRDLKTLAATGEFRSDLFYRLNVISLQLPALRDRGKDILKIAQSFLERQMNVMGKTDLVFTPEAEQAILTYTWPGNVRELENAVERAVILCESNNITIDNLGLEPEVYGLASLGEDELTNIFKKPHEGAINNKDPKEGLSLEDYFQRFVLENQDKMTETELARKLGVSRKCLWERRQKLGIPRKK